MARCSREDIVRAWDAVRPAASPRCIWSIPPPIFISPPTEDQPRDGAEQAREAVAFARSLCNEVEFSAEDSTRSDPDFSRGTAGGSGCRRNHAQCPDTVGYTTPSEYLALFTPSAAGARHRKSLLSAHCHKTLGWRWPIRWRPWKPGPVGGVHHHGTVNGPEMRRSKRSSWPCRCATIGCLCDRHSGTQLWTTSQMLTEITGTSASQTRHRRTQCLRHEAGSISRRYEQSSVL